MSSNQDNLSRRGFLKAAGVAGVGSILGGAQLLAGEKTPTTAPTTKPVTAVIPQRVFGKTGVKVPILAFGGILNLMDNQMLLKQAITLGVTYWDTANGYTNGNSELGIGKYFETNSADRKKVFLATKFGSSNPQKLSEGLELSLKRMQTDYIDLFYMHSQTNPRCLNDETKAWAQSAKKSGKIRHFGFTAHGNMAEMMQAAAKADFVDAIMVTYNWRTMDTDEMKKAVDACHKAKVGVCAMKTQARRSRSKKEDQSEADALAQAQLEEKMLKGFMDKGLTTHQASIKAVWQNEKIAAVCSAMYNSTVLKSNVDAATDKTKLTQGDLDTMRAYAAATCDSYCAQCGRCAAATGLPVPEVMRYMMYYNGYGDKHEARESFAALSADARRRLRTADFAGCPNGIAINEAMAEAREILA